MTWLRKVGRALKLLILSVAAWSAASACALAQKTAEPGAGEGSFTDYTLGYFLVAMGVALGILSVLRASDLGLKQNIAYHFEAISR